MLWHGRTNGLGSWPSLSAPNSPFILPVLLFLIFTKEIINTKDIIEIKDEIRNSFII